jgi:hypothetical protein
MRGIGSTATGIACLFGRGDASRVKSHTGGLVGWRGDLGLQGLKPIFLVLGAWFYVAAEAATHNTNYSPGEKKKGCDLAHPFRCELNCVSDLFAEDEDFLLAGEADFADFAGVVEKHGVVDRLGVAIFPAAFALGDDGLAFLHGGFVAVDQKTILSRVELRRTESGGLVNVDGFADRLSENRYGQRDHREQYETPKN